MDIQRLEVTPQILADIVVKDRDGRTTLIVEVKGWTAVRKVKYLISYLEAANGTIPFAMFVDLESIQIFKWGSANLSEPVCSLKTADVLCHYDAEFSKKRIYWDYLRTLVEAWLRDLDYHWKLEIPPASDELAAIGLLPLLKDAETETEVYLGGNSLN